jgi:hypothetical protein
MQERKRLFIDTKTGSRQRVEIIKWAATSNYDAIVFPLSEKLSPNNTHKKLAKKYDLIIEAGGHELSLLLPRRLFLFNRDLFRMEQGKRKKKHHFCTTNPEVTAIIAESAQDWFSRSLAAVTAPRIFHLLPDEKGENIWCACPACRAFTPAEQNIIAVNTAADELTRLDPQAKLSYKDLDTEPEKTGLLPRRLFMFNRDLFRMEQGKRKKEYHFCTTNPETTTIIAEGARDWFARSLAAVTIPRIFHLLPDEEGENIWCACPACRAFTPAEQNIIAVNTAADVLVRLDPEAKLSYKDLGTEPEKAGVLPRKNMFSLS